MTKKKKKKPTPVPKKENVPQESQAVHAVEALISKRVGPSGAEFLVKWDGYPNQKNTWEPIEKLSNCKRLISDYEKQLSKKLEPAIRAPIGPYLRKLRMKHFERILKDSKEKEMQLCMSPPTILAVPQKRSKPSPVKPSANLRIHALTNSPIKKRKVK